jgi:hypothetical protein
MELQDLMVGGPTHLQQQQQHTTPHHEYNSCLQHSTSPWGPLYTMFRSMSQEPYSAATAVSQKHLHTISHIMQASPASLCGRPCQVWLHRCNVSHTLHKPVLCTHGSCQATRVSPARLCGRPFLVWLHMCGTWVLSLGPGGQRT